MSWNCPVALRVISAASAASIASAAIAGATSFTVIGLPDTQFYSESYPEIFEAQTQWVADNIDFLGIEFVSHYGDVVQHGDDLVEWARAEIALMTLDASGIPWGVSAGNHDITPVGGDASGYIPQYFEERYGPSHWQGKPWFVGCSPSGMSNAQVFEAGGHEWLWLHLECDVADRELSWAQGVLDRNRDKACIVTTHRWLQDAEDYTGGVPVVPSGRYPGIWYTIEGVHAQGGIQGEDAWRWFFRQNPSIFMINCGHFHEEYRQVSTNFAGLPVHEVLADYQDDPNGGNGWLRIMEFDVAADAIYVESYSPTLDEYRYEDESMFTLNVDFDAYRLAPGTAFAAFQQGVLGYDGTRDTWISEDEPDTAYGDDGVKEVDDDTTNGIFSDEEGQTLLKFTGVFGDGEGRVPAGAQIIEAWLTIELANDIDHPIFDPDFYVYEMLVPWEESSTWNSMNGGLSPGQDLGQLIATFAGDNDPDGDATRRINVTGLVQAWSNGQPNYGFGILPEIISGNDDGISIFTSESGTAVIHPRLEIMYEAPEPACDADLTGDDAVNSDDLFELLGAWGACAGCDADLTGDDAVNSDDLFELLGAWGDC
jgi:hypothetical protein